ncbi:hypothetical protein ACNPQK_01925 [Acinetobacter guillouiae]|uniref:hypothetical protein n=1 Tax=Acinetobacter guillouiae TaxID=106649 RepID=UPI003AF587B7
MDKFEEAICGHNPLYKEGLQDKYYQGAKWAWQSRQAEVDDLKNLLEKDEYAHNLYYENANLQTLIEELERSCISYKNQRDDNAQKLMVKSVHYNSIQEELAKLKDRLELAHHLATQSTWSSLKQLKKVVKALRGEHE